MNYNIKGTGLSVSDEIRSYLEKRLTYVEKFLKGDSTALVDVELERQTSEDRQHYRAELTLTYSGASRRAEAIGDTLHEAIDIAVGELASELQRTKGKRMRLIRRGASKIKDFVRGFRKEI